MKIWKSQRRGRKEKDERNRMCVTNNQYHLSLIQHGLLLGRDTHRLSETTSGLGVLTTDLQVPIVTKTTVSTIHYYLTSSPTASSSDGSDPHGDWPGGC